MREKLVLIAEADYVPMQWYQDALGGVISQSKRSGFELSVLTRLPDDKQSAPGDARVLLFGMSAGWMARALAALSSASIIVAINQSANSVPRNVHTVSIDRAHGVTQMIKSLVQSGRKRIAMFGVDKHSVGDRERAQAYIDAGARLGALASAAHIYPNHALLADSAQALCARAGEYDAVICVNDYSAVVLMRALKNAGARVPDDIAVAGYGNLTICRHVTPTLTSVTMDFREAGAQAVNVIKLIARGEGHVNVSLTLEAKIVRRESTPGDTRAESAYEGAPETGGRALAFHQDPDVRRLQSINEMLATSDEIDISILAGIGEGLKYQQIADTAYISFSALKNRLKRLRALSGAASRRDMEALINEFSLNFRP